MVYVGVRGTVVAVGELDRSREQRLKCKKPLDKVSSLNNFDFTVDGQITAQRAYKIGTGQVSRKSQRRHLPKLGFRLGCAIFDNCVLSGVQG